MKGESPYPMVNMSPKSPVSVEVKQVLTIGSDLFVGTPNLIRYYSRRQATEPFWFATMDNYWAPLRCPLALCCVRLRRQRSIERCQ